LSVEAAGSSVGGLRYQWRKDGEVIAGATGSEYVLEALGYASGGEYDVVVSSEVQSVVSGRAVLRMDPDIAGLVVQGRTNVGDGKRVWVNPGEGFWMRVEARSATTAEGALGYVWERRDAGGAFVPVSGAGIRGGTSDTLWIESVSGGAGGHAGVYRVSVRGALGVGTSSVVEVGVREPALVEGIEVTSRGVAVVGAVAGGAPVLLRGRVSGTEPAMYTWYRNGSALSGAVSGGTTELSLAAVSVAEAGWYQLEMENEAGRSLSAPVRLEVADGGVGTDAGSGTGGAGGTGEDGALVGVGTPGGGGSPADAGAEVYRWWVYEVVGGGVEGLPEYWVYDRYLRRSAWVGGGVALNATDLRVDRWEEEDQDVDVAWEGRGLSVFGLRVRGGDWSRWDGFELEGVYGAAGIPWKMSGRYGASGAVFGNERRVPVELSWSLEQTRALAPYADWERLLQSLAEETGE
jgi:hypothetical protein